MHATAAELGRRLRAREIGCVELAQWYLDRIAGERLGAFLAVDGRMALEDAKAAQARIDSGSAGPLTGVPFAVKDNILTKGLATTCGSRILEGYVPPYEAETVARCRAAGMVLLGKTNLDEFGMGTTNENSAFGVCRNPWDVSRSPGGSSGGSAAAVSAGLAAVALGTDTGGSVRQPAAMCGLVGFKPSYGRASRYGVAAYGSSLDQVGVLAQTTEDAALAAEAFTGHDPQDATSWEAGPVRAVLGSVGLEGVRLAWPRQLRGAGFDPGVLGAAEQAVAALCRAGAVCEEVDVPTLDASVATYYVIAPAEASSNLARYDGVRMGVREDAATPLESMARTRGRRLGHEVQLRIMVGTYALSSGYYDQFYAGAMRARAAATHALDRLLREFDAVVSPTSPVPATPLTDDGIDQLEAKLLDLCTIPANLGGYPSLSLPCGLADGLPVGLAMTAARGEDEALLAAAHAAESCLGLGPMRPPGRP